MFAVVGQRDPGVLAIREQEGGFGEIYLCIVVTGQPPQGKLRI
jgi:hypothetical protein